MPPGELPDDLIAPKALAYALAVHISTVHRWIHLGKLRAWRRAGHRYLVSRGEGLALIAPVEVEACAAPACRADEELAAAQAAARLRAKGYK